MADRVAVMRAGRIVQIGPPQELYTRPATRFVAEFLGETNFVDGQLLGPGPVAKIRTSAGILLAANVADLPTETPVTCSVRPERIEIAPCNGDQAPDARGQVALIRATIESTTYLGEIRQYVCRLDPQIAWKVSVLSGSAPALPPGVTVILRVTPEDVALLTR